MWRTEGAREAWLTALCTTMQFMLTNIDFWSASVRLIPLARGVGGSRDHQQTIQQFISGVEAPLVERIAELERSQQALETSCASPRVSSVRMRLARPVRRHAPATCFRFGGLECGCVQAAGRTTEMSALAQEGGGPLWLSHEAWL